MRLIGETGGKSDLGQRHFLEQHPAGAFDAHMAQIGMRRQARRLAEGADHVARRDAGDAGQVPAREGVGEMGMNMVGGAAGSGLGAAFRAVLLLASTLPILFGRLTA